MYTTCSLLFHLFTCLTRNSYCCCWFLCAYSTRCVVLITSKGRLATRGPWTNVFERLGAKKGIRLKGNQLLISRTLNQITTFSENIVMGESFRVSSPWDSMQTTLVGRPNDVIVAFSFSSQNCFKIVSMLNSLMVSRVYLYFCLVADKLAFVGFKGSFLPDWVHLEVGSDRAKIHQVLPVPVVHMMKL